MTHLDDIRSEILAAAEHVPFGNSAYQIAAFTGGEHGPERRARTLLLNMDQRIQALEEAQYRRAELAIDLDEIGFRLGALTPENDPQGFQRRRLEVDRDRKTGGLAREDKLIRDALAELETMYREWRTLPSITDRDQFERAEAGYWTRRLWSDACREIAAGGAPTAGTMAALQQIGLSAHRDGAEWRITGPAPLIAAIAALTPSDHQHQPDQHQPEIAHDGGNQ